MEEQYKKTFDQMVDSLKMYQRYELKDKNTFTKLFNNFKVMRLIEIPVYEEDEALVDNAFNIITEIYELWSFRKFVREYNGGV